MSSNRAVGIDVSAATLHVAAEGRADVAVFDNNHVGHKKLAKYIAKGRVRDVKVVVEATGSYHLDLACFIHAHKKCRVMVVNPRVAKAFQAADGGRAKTDRIDAQALLAFAQRMEFQPWTPPSQAVMEVRAMGRRVDQLIKDQTSTKNRVEAARATATTPAVVLDGLYRQLRFLELEVAAAKAALLEIAQGHEDMAEEVRVLASMPGIGPQTAAQFVSEFAFLDPEMTSKEVTAWAGMDPLPRESGTSVRGRRGISKRGNARVRRMLYMSALSGSREEGTPFHDLKMRVSRRSGKKMVGLGAVMRKMLVVAWAMYRSREEWDAEKVRPRRKVANAA